MKDIKMNRIQFAKCLIFDTSSVKDVWFNSLGIITYCVDCEQGREAAITVPVFYNYAGRSEHTSFECDKVIDQFPTIIHQCTIKCVVLEPNTLQTHCRMESMD